MNSLWNFEDGFSIPQEKEVHIGGGCWLPVTPAKPVPPRPLATPNHESENLLGRPNWPEFGAPSNGYLHEITNCSNYVQPSHQCEKLVQTEGFFGLNIDFVERNQTTNQTDGHYTQALGIDNSGSGFGTGSLSDILASGDAAFIPSMEESLTRSLVMENEALDLNFPLASNGWIELNAGGTPNATVNNLNAERLNVDCQYGIHKSSQMTYDLNSTPTRQADNSHPSGINTTSQFTPITPDHARSENPQLPLFSPLVDESVNQKQGSRADKSSSFTGTEAADPNSDELLQNIVDSFKQKDGAVSGTDEGIDLNRTPQQRQPKRKKHRPKVIKEGKAKRTKTSQTPENPNNVAGNPSGKRKYVRKKGLQETPVTPEGEDVRKNGAATERNTAKSARRALNFDLEEVATEARTVLGRAERRVQADIEDVNTVLNPQSKQQSAANNILLGASGTFVADVAQQNRFVPQYQQGSTHGIASTSMNQNTGPYYSLSQLQAAVQRQSTINHRQLGEESAFTSGHSERPLGLGVGHPNSFIGQISPSEQHCNNAGVRKPMFQPKSNLENHVNSRQVLLNRFSQAASNVARGELGLLNGQTHQSISSKVMWQRIFSTLSEAQRKTNIEERLSRVSPLVDNSRDGHMRGPYTDIASMILAAQKNDEMSRSYAANEVNQFLSNGYLQSMALRQQQLLFEQQARSRREQSLLSQMNRRESVTGVENHHFHQHLVRVSPDIPANRQNIRVSAVMNPVPTKLQTIQSRRNPPQSATETRGPTTTVKQKGLATIDDITNRLRNLHLGGEEGAIVPYKGDGTIVPFEGKKPKPRPKVDLDSETSRMWNLLMGKDRSEGLEENNQEKEKWWENEREVFRGRANSFIARMHLVQGDRRFSQWKGSVVDSVIGVFLTQNVSDHLSSSAFISLAARFPLKSTSHSGPCYKGKTKILVEEPEEFAMNGGSAFELHRNLQLVSDQSPMAVHSTRKCWRDDESSVTERTNLFEVQTYSLDEEVISSQGSFDCSTVDGSGGIKSYSGSNSQSEDLGVSHKSEGVHRSASRTSLHGEKFLFHDLCNQANGRTSYDHGSESRYEESNNKGCANGFSINTHPIALENQNMYLSSPPTSLHHLQMAQEPRVGNYDMFGKESTSSLSKASTLVGEREANGTTKMIEQALESISRSMVHEKRVPNSVQTQTTGHCIMLSKNQVQQQSCSQTVSQSGVTQPSQSILENATVEPNSNDQFSSSAKTYKEETNAKQARAKGPRAQVEKKIDWDTLRKDVQQKGARKERSVDAMDSLDYEAMRQASIKEISDTIKERGMNNMLAERIKDFLNRLVEEHGSIDLEWLRDVPPDKAKDYLLSVRGLGLKSVECVRLLTLHHLAFPVDTNVGRIAVRLGWVPLQPLPESLQLHLLELYPVLESIQKYLWPRLCRLDQRTLYELHYQLITFGKVFCTKSKPNCNACPMRGECRHFASAFASARLALPGPEDKNIVGSTVPLAEISSSVRINPVPLHPLENHPVKDGQSEAVIQPIIEEPASPEQEHRVLESDIEDGWGEDEDDDDEIPTIKLNMEEFTENLQNFMQNSNMELQEGDMSKALVALNPGVASIPTRKLKNVSRLRTEHQVYELPDDHPLLEGMQKREPDDPSPYLLAIWTPGETANSVHPPEGRCEFQDTGSLCNETTCFSCNSIKEANSQTVRGTLLIPCRTAMRGSFPLNGTYFQVNEMFADHDTSVNPIDVPRNSIWNLRRRTVYFGTSVTSIFRGLTTEEIQFCFWKGFVCVRGFERGTRAPRPLVARLHFPQSKLAKTKKSEH